MEEVATVVQTTVDSLSMAMQTNPNDSSSGIFVVMWVTLIVWGGLFVYLFYLDRQIKKVKNRIDVNEQNEKSKERKIA